MNNTTKHNPLIWWDNLRDTVKEKYARWYIMQSKFCTYASNYEDFGILEIERIYNHFNTNKGSQLKIDVNDV